MSGPTIVSGEPGTTAESATVAPLLGDRRPQAPAGAGSPLSGAIFDGPTEGTSPVAAPLPVQRHAMPEANPAASSADAVLDAIEPAGPLQRMASDSPLTAALLGDRPVASSVRPVPAADGVAPAAASSGAMSSSLGGASPTSTPDRPSVQRAVLSGAPVARANAASLDWRGGSTPAAPDSGSWVDAGAVAVASGVAQRHADGSVVFDAPADDEPVQREADGGPGGGAATAGGSGASSGAAAASGAELDELAKRLYGRMRLLLKQELRHDRERAGSLTRTRR
ncbi:MAG: hypothetical protein ACKO91_06210 [Acidimicrobiales bacterium]